MGNNDIIGDSFSQKLRDIDKELGFEENPLNSAQKSATRSNLSCDAKSTNPQELLK